MAAKRIKELTEELDSLRRTLLTLQGKNPKDKNRYSLYPPAEAKDIAQAEKKSGVKYSPNYRLFLREHNGWLGFWPDWSLVGIPRRYNAAMHADVKNTAALLPTVADKDMRDSLPEEEKKDPRVILITNHAVLGTDFNGSLLLFDRNRVGEDGEPEVAWVHYGMHVERRWRDFEALLLDAIRDTKAELEKTRSKQK